MSLDRTAFRLPRPPPPVQAACFLGKHDLDVRRSSLFRAGRFMMTSRFHCCLPFVVLLCPPSCVDANVSLTFRRAYCALAKTIPPTNTSLKRHGRPVLRLACLYVLRRPLKLFRQRGNIGFRIIHPRLGVLESGRDFVLPVGLLFHVSLEGLVVFLRRRNKKNIGISSAIFRREQDIATQTNTCEGRAVFLRLLRGCVGQDIFGER